MVGGPERKGYSVPSSVLDENIFVEKPEGSFVSIALFRGGLIILGDR